MDLMTAEQAGHFLQSQANHQSSSLANGDMPHGQHAQATHNGHQVAAGLAQATTFQSLSALVLCRKLVCAVASHLFCVSSAAMRVVKQAPYHHVSKKQTFQAHTLTESLTVTVNDSHSHSLCIVDGFIVVYHRTVQRAELPQNNTSDTGVRDSQLGLQLVRAGLSQIFLWQLVSLHGNL